MRVTIELPDSLGDLLDDQAADVKKPLPVYLAERLNEFKGVGPRDRYLLLHGGALAELEAMFQGYLTSGTQLADKVSRLAGLNIGPHRIEFTAGQWEELKHRASKRGLTVAQEIEQIWQKLKGEFFQYV